MPLIKHITNKFESKYKFYFILLLELLFLPFLYLNNFLKYYFIKTNQKITSLTERKPVKSELVSVCIHDWAGYDTKRTKYLKNGKSFLCGLDFQVDRFKSQMTKYKLNIFITISDNNKFNKNYNYPYPIKYVSNIGMDFSGYSDFYNNLKDKENQYIILTNSSVNFKQNNFLDDYIRYFEKNKNIGMLGISYNSKKYQTLIRNNFTPHLQTFFLLTTLDILNEVVKRNNNKFPGTGIVDKRLLIVDGEILLSNIVLELGYQLACVLEDGSVYAFDIFCKNNLGNKSWKIKDGDYRYNVLNPNSINMLNTNVNI